jgi:hypothetical protein
MPLCLAFHLAQHAHRPLTFFWLVEEYIREHRFMCKILHYSRWMAHARAAEIAGDLPKSVRIMDRSLVLVPLFFFIATVLIVMAMVTIWLGGDQTRVCTSG